MDNVMIIEENNSGDKKTGKKSMIKSPKKDLKKEISLKKPLTV